MTTPNDITEPAKRSSNDLERLTTAISLSHPDWAVDVAVQGVLDHPFDFSSKVAEISAALATKFGGDDRRKPEAHSRVMAASKEALEQSCSDDDEVERTLESVDRSFKASWSAMSEAFAKRERENEAERLADRRRVERIAQDADAASRLAKAVGEIHNGVSALDYAREADLNDESAREVFLGKMNVDHAVVSVSGSVRYLHRAVDKKGQTELRFMSFESMRIRYAAVRWKVGDSKWANGFDEWNRWEGRSTFDGIGFFPGSSKNPPRVPNGYLNLWTGFAIEPREGDWSKFRDHLFHKVCGGDQAKFDWLMDWSADLVQNPQRKPGTAVVLKSRSEGTGKTALATAFRKFFGQHWTKASNASHILGNFNSQLETCCVLSVEEAIWAGSKQAESVLKDLITGEELRIERKGTDAYVAENFTRLIFTSNADWVAPAGSDSRRYFVLEVANDRARDPTYFGPMFTQLENGGYEAMLHELLAREVKSDLREAPVTEALIEQREQSLDGVDRFIFEFARDGHVRSRESGEEYELHDDKPVTVDLITLADAASANCSTWERRGIQTQLAKRLSELGVQKQGRRVLTNGQKATLYEFPRKGLFLEIVLRRLGLSAELLARPAGKLTGYGLGSDTDDDGRDVVQAVTIPPSPVLH